MPYLLFLFSGVSALTYQVCWQKILALNLGSTAESLAFILSAFMGGLSLGSYFFGGNRLWRGRECRIFAFLQIGIAILGLLSPFVLFPVSYPLFPVFYIFFTSFLMGGTFPVIVKAVNSGSLTKAGSSTRNSSIGLLYSLNTWGGVIGAVLSGYFLIRYMGIKGAIWAASGINFVTAIIAFLISSSVINGGNLQDGYPPPRSGPERGICKIGFTAIPGCLILFAIFLAGFSSFVYEICWTRTLSMIIGSTTYAFTLMLAAFLTGIALGSLIYCWAGLSGMQKKSAPLTNINIFGFIQVGIGISTLLLLPVFGLLPFVFLKLFKIFSSHFLSFSISQFFLVLIPMLVPTVLMGFAFPLAIKIYSSFNRQSSTSNIGSSAGNIYAANTLGCVAGAILTSLILIPRIGLQKSILLASSLNIFIGLIFIIPNFKLRVLSSIRHPLSAALYPLFSAILAVCYLLLAACCLPQWDRNIISSGIFRDAPKIIKKENIRKSLKKDTIVFYKEGKIFTVAVKKDIETETMSLCIDGKPDASTDMKSDMVTQILSAHIPLILKPAAESCLIVGLASGITLGEVQKYPLNEIVCCEIEPAMLKACKFFNQWNNNCLDDKRTEIAIDDIRGYLKKTKKKFDVIISEPSNIWMRGGANLFTREYFQTAKKHLKDDGFLLQWLHAYKISSSDYKTVIRTLNSVFPYVYLFTGGEGDTFFLCSSKKIPFDLKLINSSFSGHKDSLFPLEIKNSLDFLSCFLMGNTKLKKFAGEGEIHTDNFPFLEFSGAQSLYSPISRFTWKQIFKNSESVNRYTQEPFTNLTFASLYLSKNKFYQTLDELNFYLERNKPDINFYSLTGLLYLKTNDLKQAEEFLNKGLELNQDDLGILTNLAELYQRKNKFDKAEKTLKKILILNQGDGVAYNNLGNLYLNLGRTKEAVAILKRGVGYNPDFFLLRLSLSAAYLKDKKIEKAEKMCTDLVRDSDNYADAYFLLGQICLAKNAPQRAQKNFNLALKLKPELIELIENRP